MDDNNALKTHFVIIGREKDSFIESYVGEKTIKTEEGEEKNLGDFFLVIEILNKYEEGEDIGEAITPALKKL